MKKTRQVLFFPDFFKRRNLNFCVFLCRRWLLAMVLCLDFSVGVLAQQQKVSVNVKNADISVILRQINEQTKLNFVYDPDQLASMSKITLDVKNEVLETVLANLFANTPFEYRFEMETVLIRLKEKGVHESAVREITLTGVVKDAQGNLLPGVTVILKGTSIGTATDPDGNFKLNLPSGNDMVLVFSFIGMETQEVRYVGQKNMEVVMKEDAKEMEEVVVTGIFQRSKSSYTPR